MRSICTPDCSPPTTHGATLDALRRSRARAVAAATTAAERRPASDCSGCSHSCDSAASGRRCGALGLLLCQEAHLGRLQAPRPPSCIAGRNPRGVSAGFRAYRDRGLTNEPAVSRSSGSAPSTGVGGRDMVGLPKSPESACPAGRFLESVIASGRTRSRGCSGVVGWASSTGPPMSGWAGRSR